MVARGTNSRFLAPHTDRPVTVLNLQSIARVERLEPADYYVTCQAGLRLAQLHYILNEMNLHFPFLSGESSGTVGGMVASGQINGIGGSFGISRWVLAVRVILANGEVISTGAVTYKSVAGYDLPKLFCGSFGTLGAITSVSLRLYPIGSGPFGKDLLPVSPRMPILTDIGKVSVPQNRANEIALRIKKALDPKGLFPAISGWNA